MKKLLILLSCLLMLVTANICNAQVTLGVERLGEPQVQQMLAHKRVGLFTNQSGVDRRLTSSVELVRAQADLQAIFVPEHGLFGAEATRLRGMSMPGFRYSAFMATRAVRRRRC